MQKWEYTTLVARSNKVIPVNEQQIGKITFLGTAKGESLYDVLSDLGSRGWEVVGISPISGTGDHPSDVSMIIILKRPFT